MPRRWLRFNIRSILLFIAIVGVLFGLRTRTIQRQNRAVNILREFGGQLDSPSTTLSAWVTGISTSIGEVYLLGPQVGDEAIEDIIEASIVLDLNLITFTETRISQRGEQKLRTDLPRVEIKVVTPVLVPAQFR